ncbi:MAG: hypothetical protein GTO63_25895 [Anaerolineae bacterium]|nr:hypothetical protein [Anaerolineae bacterium]NIN98177.1 hypothetical protein [Anaerolineae bacterium]
MEEVIGDMIGHCLLLLEELRPTCTQPYDPMEFTAHDWWCTYVEAMSEWQDEEAPSDG